MLKIIQGLYFFFKHKEFLQSKNTVHMKSMSVS